MVVNEVQGFRGSILMYGMLLLELPTLILMFVLWQTGKLGDDGPYVFGFVVCIMLLIFWLLMSIRLELKLTTEGISYRNPPFLNRWVKISPEKMESIEVKKMDGLLEYGGVGVRFARKTRGLYLLCRPCCGNSTSKKKTCF
jgi:hypothetical protein